MLTDICGFDERAGRIGPPAGALAGHDRSGFERGAAAWQKRASDE